MSSSKSDMRVKLEKGYIEWPIGKSTFFLPISALDEIVQPTFVLKELQRVYPDRLGLEKECQQICDAKNPSKKLFAIHLGPGGNEKAILDFLAEGIRDADLPFNRIYSQDQSFVLARSDDSGCQLQEHSACGIRAMRGWEPGQIHDLCRNQLIPLAPVFEPFSDRRFIPHHDLKSGCPLPFIKDGELFKDEANMGIMSGGYSDVWGVIIHPAHQKFFKARNNREPIFAVKRLHKFEEKAFQLERNMLVELSSLKHPHLITLLVTWTRESKYFMLFPYAKQNLRSFWSMTNLHYRNPQTWLWTITQMAGLAEGLRNIHIFRVDPDVNRNSTSRTGVHLAVDPAHETYGRHGDLKPENILLLDDSNSEASDGFGVLQIADFGLSRFHRKESRSDLNARDILSSQTYQPPELYLLTPVSRAYDIWSLGCVYLEFISWMLGGSKGVTEFTEKRSAKAPLKEQLTDDMFYTELEDDYGRKVAKVRQGVLDWIQHQSGSRACSLMIEDLLLLVRDHMLLIPSDDRFKIEELDERLKCILEKAKNNPFYLFKT